MPTILFRCIRYLPVVAACLLLVAGTGCKEAIDSTQQPTLPAINEETQHAAYTLAVIYPMSHPFFEPVTKEAEEAARQAQVNIIVKSPEEANLEQQIRMMENLIKQQVDGIAIDPVDPDALTPYINKAVEAGIKVICFDSDAPDSKRLSFIGSHNRQAGIRLGQTVAELMNGRGMIIASTGMNTMMNMREREEGFKDALKAHPDIQLLELRSNHGDPAISLQNLEEMIEAHPHFDAFVGFDSLSGPSAIMVWKAKGLTQTAVAFDDMPEILEGIRNGQLTATVSQQESRWGYLIVTRLIEAIKNKDIPAIDDSGSVVITKDNVDTFR
ncbi:sugar ABC transporter substrate-binding protein [Paenibacillus hexagrammi]|uniref:Substrate-binding domain-containing protein n=1 Tax=Paenibacillus hexagrammi TaxID=2908839 RepID=A0ABY3SHA1_9BACL|nr:substrate-binding domain-containing protein [Paenibacillus sp. YPD9-1]UJF32566.1 substrate-binding domain-containing protein [Paenibacillus sp. YPD9-1]